MRKLREIFLKAALIAAAVITGGILLFLIGIILKRGLPQLSWSFLTTATSYLAGTTGILPNICNTLYLILIAMGAALPLGVGAAHQLCRRNAHGYPVHPLRSHRHAVFHQVRRP